MKTNKLIIYILFFINTITVYAQERLLLIDYRGYPYDNSYLELSYDINQPVFVSEELNDGLVFLREADNRYFIFYLPRGNSIIHADESTKWPPILRRIMPGEILVFRINIKKILSKFEISSINEITLIVVDVIYLINDNSNQTYYFPTDINTKNVLQSNEILLIRNEDGCWEMQ